MATNANYVRFIRGTPTAWANLKTKDPDVLYFISEKGAMTGALYLGDKLITGNDQTLNITTSVSKLTDVSLGVKISNGDVLVYDASTQMWTNKNPLTLFDSDGNGSLDLLSDFVEKTELEKYATLDDLEEYALKSDLPKVFTGATSYDYGTKGLVPTPRPGQQNFVLSGSGEWIPQNSNFEYALTILYGTDGHDKSIREIAQNEVLKVAGSNIPPAYNTIEKIANWILANGGGSSDGQSASERLERLEIETFGEDKTAQTSGNSFDIQQLNKIVFGKPEIGLEGLSPKMNRLEATMEDLDSSVSALRKNYNSLSTTVIDLDERLTWKKY